MTLLFEWLPTLVFFITYRWQGVYTATACLMIASALQILTYWLRGKNIPILQWISFVLLNIMGTATLVIQNSLFIKLKPSLVYWALASVCAISPYWKKTNLVQHFLSPLLDLPERLWVILNRCWIIFFISLGLLNVLAVYFLKTPSWIYFKVFGLMGIKLLFLFLQLAYLSRFIKLTHERS